MELFVGLFIKILPLYIFMIIGYIGGRLLNLQRETVGTLLLYFFIPVVYFTIIATAVLSPATLSLSLLFFILCSCMCLLFLFIGKYIWQDRTKNILAQAAGDGNYGYFAIPVALILFPANIAALVVFCGVGFIFYENTVGFYIAASGHNTAKEAIKKLLTFPAIYAIILALLVNYFHVNLGTDFFAAAANVKGGYVVLGSMIIGLGLSTVRLKGQQLDWMYVLIAFIARFLVWPILMTILLFLDNQFFHFYSPAIHKVLILMSVIPLAANTIVFAIALQIETEKVAVAILLSTLFALILIPIVAVYFLQ